MKWLPSSVLFAALLLTGCGDKAPPPAPATAAPPYPVLEVSATKAVDERWLDGRVEGVEQATVASQTAGEVVAVVHDIADRVGRGEVIIRVRAIQQQSGLQQAEAALAEASAREVEASKRLSRIAALFERKAVPRATLDEATAAERSAVARASAARAAVDAAREGVGYTVVRAPFGGVVTDRYVNVGAIVAPGMPLFGIAATDRLRVVTDLPEQFAAAVRTRGEVYVLANGERIRASQVIVQPRADARSGAVGLRVDLPAGIKDLQPGTVIRLAVVTGEATPLRVPLSSVAERSEVTGVYVYDPKKARTSFRQLRLGRMQDGEVEVLAGLVAGESVARDPSAALRHISSARASR